MLLSAPLASLTSASEQLVQQLGYLGLVLIMLLGRMVPGLRSIVSLPPGLLRMPFGRYLALTALGSLAWNALLIVLGRQLGSQWTAVAGVVGPIAQIVLLACIPLVTGWFVLRRRARSARG